MKCQSEGGSVEGLSGSRQVWGTRKKVTEGKDSCWNRRRCRGAPHAEGGRRKEEKGAPGFKARRRGCLRCVVRSWADERGCPGHGAEGKTDRHQLGLDDKRPGRGSPLSGLIPSVSCLWRKRGPGRRDCPGKRFGGGHGPGPPPPWEPSVCPGQPTDGEDVEGALGAGLDGKDRRAKEGTPPGRGEPWRLGG